MDKLWNQKASLNLPMWSWLELRNPREGSESRAHEGVATFYVTGRAACFLTAQSHHRYSQVVHRTLQLATHLGATNGITSLTTTCTLTTTTCALRPLADVGLDQSSFQLICRWKQVVVGHNARTFRAYFANTLFLCSNDSPSLFVDDVLQHWTMVKLVLMPNCGGCKR